MIVPCFTPRHSTAWATVVVMAVSATGCANGSRAEPEESKRSVVDLVDQSTEAIGGDWSLIGGPGISSCPKPRGGRGASYVYTMTLDATGDRTHDLKTIEGYWTELGLSVGRYRSGGIDPDLGIIGDGENGAFIDLLAIPDHYTIVGQSECMDRDPDPLRSPVEL